MINLPESRKVAISAIDADLLRGSIEREIECRGSGALSEFSLWQCGEFIEGKRQFFAKALDAFRHAKSQAKTERTEREARKAGDDILYAVSMMKTRLIEEERDALLFVVDDYVEPPVVNRDELRVRVGYRWRASAEDEWTLGHITFLHKSTPWPHLGSPTSTRTVSKAQKARENEDRLVEEWDHMMRNALFSVRDFFRAGGDGKDIPVEFRAIPDRSTGGLNNHSLKFWSDRDKSQP